MVYPGSDWLARHRKEQDMTYRTTFAALGLLAGLAAGAAHAGNDGRSGMMHEDMDARFEALDTDGSGGISPAEMEAARMAHFAEADTDGDGKLSRDEAAEAGGRMGASRALAMFERFDTDGDGMLALEDLPRPRDPERRFGRMDRDDNGEISREEFAEARQGGRHGAGRMHGRGHGKGHGHD
jgi:Ca2+-binding EF-hand superfamily protein